MNNVIIALATPPLKGALALIRVSGDGAFEITDQIFSKRVSDTKKREIYYGTMSDNGQPIDLVLVMAFKGPNTFTGEDIVEISCHGSMLIANQIIEAVNGLLTDDEAATEDGEEEREAEKTAEGAKSQAEFVDAYKQAVKEWLGEPND